MCTLPDSLADLQRWKRKAGEKRLKMDREASFKLNRFLRSISSYFSLYTGGSRIDCGSGKKTGKITTKRNNKVIKTIDNSVNDTSREIT